MASILSFPSRDRYMRLAFGRCSSPAFDAGLSSEYFGRDFSKVEAMQLRNITRHGNDIQVDRTPAYNIDERRRHDADVQMRRAAIHLL